MAEPASSTETFTEDWWEEEQITQEESEAMVFSKAKEQSKSNQAPDLASATNLVKTGMSFLSQLTQTLSDPLATEKLVQQITEKDEQTGQTYVKLPVESEQVVKNAMKLFSGLLSNIK